MAPFVHAMAAYRQAAAGRPVRSERLFLRRYPPSRGVITTLLMSIADTQGHSESGQGNWPPRQEFLPFSWRAGLASRPCASCPSPMASPSSCRRLACRNATRWRTSASISGRRVFPTTSSRPAHTAPQHRLHLKSPEEKTLEGHVNQMALSRQHVPPLITSGMATPRTGMNHP
jgi:hypothetical protein